MVLAMTSLGIWLLIWPSAIDASAFRFILFESHSGFLPWFFITCGALSAMALGANGHIGSTGCRIRAWAAMIRGVLWLEMAIALVLLFINTGSIPSPGIPIYSVLMVGELLSCYVAARDGIHYKRLGR